jgi:hypothetical protein
MSPYGFPDEMVKMTNKAIEELKSFLTDPEAAFRQREKNTLLAIDAEAAISMLTAQFPMLDAPLIRLLVKGLSLVSS